MAWTNSKPLKSLLTMCALRVLGKKLSDRPSNRNMCTNVFFVQYTRGGKKTGNHACRNGGLLPKSHSFL